MFWLVVMALGLIACSSSEDSPEDRNPPGDEEPVAEATDYLVGPIGTDNGQISACTGTHASNPAVVCVDTALGNNSGPGTAASPYRTISQAITAAKAGDTIQIAQGTYAENPVIGSYGNFSSKRLNILGGFQSGSSFSVRNQGTYRTLLDNNLANSGLRLHVGAGANNMTVDGLAIRRGKGLGTNWQNGYGHGGGVYAQWTGSGVLTLSHLEVYDSQTNSIAANSQIGGGIYLTTNANGASTGRIKVQDSHIYNNKGGWGAGIGGQGNLDILRNRIEGNLGQNDHGGGFWFAVSGGTFEDNLVKSNVTGILAGYGWGGGGVFSGGSVALKRNVWTNNDTPLIGSGFFLDEQAVATMEGDLFYKNQCTNNGHAIYVDGAGSSGPGSTLTATNITVADHSCSGPAIFLERQSTVTLKNSILWGNSGGDIGGQSGTSWSATYSVTSLSGTGNITSNPQFVDSAGNDYHLKSTAGHWTSGGWVTDATTSPAIDAGDPASAFTNEPAPNGSRINMGFEGNTAEASKSATLDYEACPGQPHTITMGASPTVLSGNLTTSADDESACGTTGTGDRIYRLNLSATGGILHLSTDNGTLGVRTTCGSAVGEQCDTDLTFQASESTYYVIVEGSGSFNLTVDYDTSVCGDGFVASNEECEPPTPFCNSSCESEAPDPDAEDCPGKGYNIPSGESALTASADDLTTVNYADNLTASCGGGNGGQDYVLAITPAITGTLTVRIGYDANDALICDSDTCTDLCWDAVLSARTDCDSAGSEIACENDTYGGEELVISVTASTPVFLIVDGINAGHYAKGPFDLQFDLQP
ncbi:DUF1565 domain-containing protein [Patescibacteria group bacterium]|nr:DUF1565 domain-containing protein [Patescibacteria group bacterium]